MVKSYKQVVYLVSNVTRWSLTR